MAVHLCCTCSAGGSLASAVPGALAALLSISAAIDLSALIVAFLCAWNGKTQKQKSTFFHVVCSVRSKKGVKKKREGKQQQQQQQQNI